MREPSDRADRRTEPSPGARLLRGVAAVVAVVAVVLLVRTISGGVKDLTSVDRKGAELIDMTIDSDAVGRPMPVKVVRPGGVEDSEERPLLVFLHGRGGEGESSNLDEAMYSALSEQGDRAPVVAFPNGDDASYWHDRDSGDWGTYVTDEVIPQVTEQLGTDPDRVAIGGISMGGFGAFDIARLNPGEFCAVGGHSPALWRTGGETAPGAFDDAEDFARHDVVAAAEQDPEPYLGQPVWVDAGSEDPFVPGIDAFTAALEEAGADLTSRRPPGGHDGSYWDEHWPEYMRFYSNALARCE